VTTITSSSTIGINLNPASYTNPVVIGAGITITNPFYPNALYTSSSSTTSFIIQNDGTIDGSDIGVYLVPGGSVTNATTGSIAGTNTGVEISEGAGTVVNNGNIISVLTGGYTTTGIGVNLLSGGSVTNTSDASIVGGYFGVDISGNPRLRRKAAVVLHVMRRCFPQVTILMEWDAQSLMGQFRDG
jgi:hypothetical protein